MTIRPQVLPLTGEERDRIALLRPAEPSLGLPEPQLVLREPRDIDAAYKAWGANCGPAALAAAIGVDLEQVRGAVGGPSWKGYMGVVDMRDAIDRCPGVCIAEQWSKPARLPKTDGSPVLLLIHWGGPWSTVPRAAAKHRHWIVFRDGYVGASASGFVFDVNCGWVPRADWIIRTLPNLLPDRADGTMSIGWACTVRT